MFSYFKDLFNDKEKESLTNHIERMVVSDIGLSADEAKRNFFNIHKMYSSFSAELLFTDYDEMREGILSSFDKPVNDKPTNTNDKPVNDKPTNDKPVNSHGDNKNVGTKDSQDSKENEKTKGFKSKVGGLCTDIVNKIHDDLIGLFGLTYERLNEKLLRKNRRGKKKNPKGISEEHTFIKNERFKNGTCCPECNQGRLYTIKNGRIDSILRKIKETHIRTIRTLETLRCNACNYRNSAKAPVSPGEYNGLSAEVRVDFAIDTTDGIPSARQEKRLQDAGVDISRKDINLSNQNFGEMLQGVVNCMALEISNAASISADSTSMRVLEVTQKESDPSYVPGTKKDSNDRVSTRATCIIGKDIAQNIMAIQFHVDQLYPGEHLEDLLEKRTELSKPIYMSDMLSAQVDAAAYKKSKDEKNQPYYRAGCLDHLMVKLKKAYERAPEAMPLIEELQKVYYFDKIAKTCDLSVEDRYELHKIKSQPIMEGMFKIAKELLPPMDFSTNAGKEKKRGSKGSFSHITDLPPSTSSHPKVEPNSEFGKVLIYFLKHFQAFSEFYKRPGVPLSNINCEQAHKRIILFRKTSYLFRSLESAKLHANLFSTTSTARAIGLNVYDYHLTMLKNEASVKENPHLWTPLAYLKRLEQFGTPPPEKISSLYKPFRPTINVEKTSFQ